MAAAAASAQASRRREVISDFHTLLHEPSLHLGADSVEVFLGAGLEPHHEHRLCVRGANESPPVAIENSYAVHIDHLVLRREILRCLSNNVEFGLIRAWHPNFRRGYESGYIRHHLLDALAGVGNDAEKACSTIHRIVEAIPALSEEHVPGHFAGERRMSLVHFFFDQGMAGLPHDWLAA